MERTEKIYKLLLLNSNGLTRPEICKKLNMKKTTAYDSLVKLMSINRVYKKKFYSKKRGRPAVIFVANQPKTIQFLNNKIVYEIFDNSLIIHKFDIDNIDFNNIKLLKKIIERNTKNNILKVYIYLFDKSQFFLINNNELSKIENFYRLV